MTVFYAHRGFSSRYPENTRASFEAAFKAGADGIEADLQKCADGTFVILHDPTLDRTTDRKGSLKDLTWDQVKDARIQGTETILTLEDLLALMPADKLLNLELKSETITRADVDSVLKIILYTRGRANTMISSFSHNLLPPFRKEGFKTGALLGEEHSQRGVPRLLLDLALTRPSHVNAPIQSFEKLSQKKADLFFRGLKTLGLKLAFWTINRDEDFLKVRPYADALIGDDVEAGLRWLRRT